MKRRSGTPAHYLSNRRPGRPLGIVPLLRDRDRFAVAIVAALQFLPGCPAAQRTRARLVSFLLDSDPRARLEIDRVMDGPDAGGVNVAMFWGTQTTIPLSRVNSLSAKVSLVFDRLSNGAYSPAERLWMSDSMTTLIFMMTCSSAEACAPAMERLVSLGWADTCNLIDRKIRAEIISCANSEATSGTVSSSSDAGGTDVETPKQPDRASEIGPRGRQGRVDQATVRRAEKPDRAAAQRARAGR